MKSRNLMIIYLIFLIVLSNYPTAISYPSSLEGKTDFKMRSSSFQYHNYTQLVEELKQLNKTYPGLIDLYSAQEKFGVPDCQDGYKIWIVRITNESITNQKTKVLYVGGHHGDEDISIEVPFYFISWLLENYNSDSNIKFIVDNRELFIIPVLNPYGWEHNSRFDANDEDVNRDYPYGNESSNEALTTVGAKAMHELMKQHIFTAGITWHSGMEVIYYAWGTPIHNTLTDESPDHSAFNDIGDRLSSYAGNYHYKYPHGPANRVLLIAYGAWSDYAYASSWDTAGMDPDYPINTARMLAFGVEISTDKRPDESTMGTKIDLYCSPDDVDGYIPKNIRLGFALAELAEPYILLENEQDIPKEVAPLQNVTFTWRVGGAVNVDKTNIQYGLYPSPTTSFNFTTENQSGPGGFNSTIFNERITMPEEEGIYYFTISARVDKDYLEQLNPEPKVGPQSVYVNTRTNESYSITHAGKTITGKVDHFSEVIAIEVKRELQPKVEVVDPPKSGLVSVTIELEWTTWDLENHPQDVFVLRSESQDNFTYQQSFLPEGGIFEGFDNDHFTTRSKMKLPSFWGHYNYKLEVVIASNKSIFSDIFSMFIKPNIYFSQIDDLIDIKDTFEVKWILDGTNVPFDMFLEFNPDFILDGSSLSKSKKSVTGINDFHSMLITAPDFGGKYNIRVNASYTDNNTETTYYFNSDWSPIKVNDKITVTIPVVTLDIENSMLIITDIHAESSNLSRGIITPNNTITAEILIVNSDDEGVFFTDLVWSGSYWYVLITNLTNFSAGKYYVLASFWDGLSFGESVHSPGDTSEFVVPELNETTNGEETKEEEEEGEISQYMLSITVIIIIAVLVIIGIIYTRTRSKGLEYEQKDQESEEISEEKSEKNEK